MIRGTVTKSTGMVYAIRLENGEKIEAGIKGKLRLDKGRNTNPVAVGDQVAIYNDGKNYVIEKVEERKNYIIRKSNKLSSRAQIIASNLDLAVIVATHEKPHTPRGFIDRFLVTAEAYHIKPLIVFNKSDLKFEDKLYSETEKIYSEIGYTILNISVLTGENISELKEILHNKTSLFMGFSGVGKTSLLNILIPDLNKKTAAISERWDRGMHTTTFAEMFELPDGGCVIDTPGVRDFGIIDLNTNEISHYFPEMKKYIHLCKYNNCIHVNEPDCAVLAAMNENKISVSRYVNYLGIMSDETLEKRNQ